MNVIEIEERIEQIAKEGFKSADFIFDFIAAYDAPKAVLKQLRQGQQNPSEIGGVLWRRYMHYKGASKGAVSATIDQLHNAKENAKHKVRYIISTDGYEFAARDLKSGETLNCNFSKLGDHFGFFLPLANIERYKIADENPVDIKATGRLAKFYDSILEDNPSWRGDEMRHTLNHFMTQIVFCLFAEDTGIFPQGLFSEALKTYCETDTAQTQSVLTHVFRAMSLPEGERGNLPTYATRFPYVNGGLFNEKIEVPRFLRGSVRYLLDAAMLDWREINPDIFGSMIQSIVNVDQRGELGMHYTSVPNILKVLDPLFLDNLRDEVTQSWNSKKGLHAILHRISKIRVFDPACGSGNFLVIAYRELRGIEITAINRLANIDNYSAPLWSNVELKNFYGIEYADFAAETARLSLWIAEYQMNSRYENAFGKRSPVLPLRETGNIVCANALQFSWESVCPPANSTDTETYIVGNPPYLGDKLQTEQQKNDLETIFAESTDRWKSLDYVAGWFKLAADQIAAHGYSAAFVSTNSIAQGQQAPTIMPFINNNVIEISFTHTSFVWKNNAADRAGVICVIIGFRKKSSEVKFIITGDEQRRVKNINHYLIDSTNLIIDNQKSPIGTLPEMLLGNMPKDDGNLILSNEEAEAQIERTPAIAKFIRPYGGSEELIKGTFRKCLWITDSQVTEALTYDFISERIEGTKRFRLASKKAATREWAAQPYRFVEIRSPAYRNALIIPRVSSIRRSHLPCGFAPPNTIVSDSAYALYDPPMWSLSILASRLHLTWISTVCGKLKNDFRYSSTMGWNTFPVPHLTSEQLDALSRAAEQILLARDNYFEKTISELYDPDTSRNMYPELALSHQHNDSLIEELYFGRPLRNDDERIKLLFDLYAKMADTAVQRRRK